MAAVATDGFRAFRAAMEKESADAVNPEQRLAAISRAYVTFALAYPARMRLMFGPDCTDKSKYPDLVKAAGESFSVIAQAMTTRLAEKDAAPLDPIVAVLAAWSITHGLSILLMGRPFPPELSRHVADPEIVRQVLTIFGAGLRAAQYAPAPEVRTGAPKGAVTG